MAPEAGMVAGLVAGFVAGLVAGLLWINQMLADARGGV